MSDRINGCVVAFDGNLHAEDAERILNAIRMIKGVIAVESQVADPQNWVTESRVRAELRDKLWNFLWGKDGA